MKVTISNKNKKDLFVALFQILKNCTSIVTVIFEKEKCDFKNTFFNEKEIKEEVTTMYSYLS